MGKKLAKLFYWKKSETVTTIPASLWDIDIQVMTDKPNEYRSMKFGDLRDENTKAYLIINVSNACNLAGVSFRQLKALHKDLADKGLRVIAVPCLQYDKINKKELSLEQCGIRAEDAIRTKYQVEFPVLKSDIVNGEDCCDLYKWLRAHCDYFNTSLVKAKKFKQYKAGKSGKIELSKK